MTEDLDLRADAFDDIDSERERQVALFGEQNHHPAYWLALLGKQMGQLGEAVVQREWRVDKANALNKVREEAVQIAAVAVAMIEAIDRGNVPSDLTTAKPNDPRQLARSLNVGDESIHGRGEIDRDELSFGRPIEDAALPEGKGMTNDLC